MAPVALPRMFHHLTTGGERGGEGGKDGREEGKMTNVIKKRAGLSNFHTGFSTMNKPQLEQKERQVRLPLLLMITISSTSNLTPLVLLNRVLSCCLTPSKTQN